MLQPCFSTVQSPAEMSSLTYFLHVLALTTTASVRTSRSVKRPSDSISAQWQSAATCSRNDLSDRSTILGCRANLSSTLSQLIRDPP